ncbi:MAG: hypothetical protein ACLTSX_13865 [Collinsella sp.]
MPTSTGTRFLKGRAKALTWTARPSYKTVKTALQKIAAETALDPDAGAYRRPDDCYDEFDGCDR